MECKNSRCYICRRIVTTSSPRGRSTIFSNCLESLNFKDKLTSEDLLLSSCSTCYAIVAAAEDTKIKIDSIKQCVEELERNLLAELEDLEAFGNLFVEQMNKIKKLSKEKGANATEPDPVNNFETVTKAAIIQQEVVETKRLILKEWTQNSSSSFFKIDGKIVKLEKESDTAFMEMENEEESLKSLQTFNVSVDPDYLIKTEGLSSSPNEQSVGDIATTSYQQGENDKDNDDEEISTGSTSENFSIQQDIQPNINKIKEHDKNETREVFKVPHIPESPSRKIRILSLNADSLSPTARGILLGNQKPDLTE